MASNERDKRCASLFNTSKAAVLTAADNARELAMEPVLRAHLHSFPLCQHRQGWRFLSYQQSSDFVDCVVQEIVSGIEQRIRCRYLVSCEGAQSRIRRAMEATLEGRRSLSQWQGVPMRRRRAHLDPDGRLRHECGYRGRSQSCMETVGDLERLGATGNS